MPQVATPKTAVFGTTSLAWHFSVLQAAVWSFLHFYFPRSRNFFFFFKKAEDETED